jgi:drug/metabolite transporter (DMT)-like permease
MGRGIACGVMAGALWGMVFLVPQVLDGFPGALVSAGRYVMYGAISLAASVPMGRALWRKPTREDVVTLFWLALLGNVLYYILLTFAVRHAGVPAASLIVGVLPVTVTLAGRLDHGALPLRRLAAPLALIVAGIACINADALGSAPGAFADRLAGVAAATGALACWSVFAVWNARYLRRRPQFDSNEWSVLWGLVTGVVGALAGIIALLLPGQPPLPRGHWGTFWLVSACIALGASWIGNGLWNAASRRLPLTLSGQMIVFETLFALLYGFIYAHRWPRALEALAIVLLVGGLAWSARAHAGTGGGAPATAARTKDGEHGENGRAG